MGEDNLTVAFAASLEGSYVTDLFNFMEFQWKRHPESCCYQLIGMLPSTNTEQCLVSCFHVASKINVSDPKHI